MYYVYCDACFDFPDDTHRKFVVTNCFHVFCSGCLTNTQNYCLICKKQCKLLALDDSTSKDVKIYFDPNAATDLIHTAQRIIKFQENRDKVIAGKNYRYRSAYYQYKQKFMEQQALRNEIIESMKHEKSNTNRCKQAYQTKVITTDVFQLRSKKDSPLINSPNDDVDMRSEAQTTKIIPSSVLKDRNSMEIDYNTRKKSTQDTSSSNFAPSKSNRGSQSFIHKNIFQAARKSLVESTLRNAQSQSQRNSQYKRPASSQNQNITPIMNKLRKI